MATVRGLACVLALAALPASLTGAQEVAQSEGPRDLLYLHGELQNASPGGGGNLAEVHWVRSLSPRLSVQAGVNRSSLGGMRWSYANFGGAVRLDDPTVLDGAVDRGSGTAGSSGFGYADYRIGVLQTLVRGRLYGRLEERYVDVGKTRGSIVAAGLIVHDAAGGSYDLFYHGSVRGNLSASAVTVRLERRVGLFKLFGGLSKGSSQAAPDLVAGSTAGGSTEIFAGVRLRLAERELTLGVDSFDSGAARRGTLLVALRLPL